MKSYLDNSVSSCVSLDDLFHKKRMCILIFFHHNCSGNSLVILLMIGMCSS